MESWLAILLVVLILGLGTAGLLIGRHALQFCPHCGWVVRRVAHGWRRCPRCHKQYAPPHHHKVKR